MTSEIVERRIIEVVAKTSDAATGLREFAAALAEFDKTFVATSESISKSASAFGTHAESVNLLGAAWQASAEKGLAFLNVARQIAETNFRIPEMPSGSLPALVTNVRYKSDYTPSVNLAGESDRIANAMYGEQAANEIRIAREQERRLAETRAESERIRNRLYSRYAIVGSEMPDGSRGGEVYSPTEVRNGYGGLYDAQISSILDSLSGNKMVGNPISLATKNGINILSPEEFESRVGQRAFGAYLTNENEINLNPGIMQSGKTWNSLAEPFLYQNQAFSEYTKFNRVASHELGHAVHFGSILGDTPYSQASSDQISKLLHSRSQLKARLQNEKSSSARYKNLWEEISYRNTNDFDGAYLTGNISDEIYAEIFGKYIDEISGGASHSDALKAMPKWSRDAIRDLQNIVSGKPVKNYQSSSTYYQNRDTRNSDIGKLLRDLGDEDETAYARAPKKSPLDELFPDPLAGLDEFGRPIQRASNGKPVRWKYDSEAFGGGFGVSDGTMDLEWDPRGPQPDFDPLGTYDQSRRFGYEDKLLRRAEQRTRAARYNAMTGGLFYDVYDPNYPAELLQVADTQRHADDGNLYSPLSIGASDYGQRQKMYEQLFSGQPTVDDMFFTSKRQFNMLSEKGDFYSRSIGSRRLYESMGSNWDELQSVNPELARKMEEQAQAARSVTQVMSEYDRGMLSAVEREQQLAQIMDEANGKFDEGGKKMSGHHENMWQMSFLLFGVAMAWQTVGQEIQKVSGEKLPSWFTTTGNAINTASSLGMTGAMLAPMLGAAGPAGLAVGAAAGFGLGMLAGLKELPPEVQALNDALDQLAKKDVVLTELGKALGVSDDEATRVMELAKSYSYLGDALKKYARDKEEKSAADNIWNNAVDYFAEQEKQGNYLFNWAGDAKRKRELGEQTNAINFSLALERATYEDQYSGVTSYLSQKSQGTNAEQFSKLSNNKMSVNTADYYLALAKEDSTFAGQLKDAEKSLLDYGRSMEYAKKNGQDFSAENRDIAATLEKVSAQAQEAERRLAVSNIDRMRNRGYVAPDTDPFVKEYGFTGVDRNVAPGFQSSQYSSRQIDAAVGTARQQAAQYLDTVRAAGYNTKSITDEWAKTSVAIQDVDGKIHVITGSAAAFLQVALQAQKAFEPKNLGYSFSDMNPQDMSKAMSLGSGALDKYLAEMRKAGMSTDDIEKNWRQSYGFIINAAGGVQTFNGKMMESLSIGQQMLAQQQKIANVWSHPSIQTMPELNAGNAPQLQAYIAQFEQLLAAQGVQQDPQRFLMFGQNGFMAQFVTSSDAMTLALALLQEQIDAQTSATKDNTKAHETQLRGHYNVPTEFGYRPPTPWEYYHNGGTTMGPVNYPWMFPDANGASGGSSVADKLKALLGMVPTNLQNYPTTLSLDPTKTAADAAAKAVMDVSSHDWANEERYMKYYGRDVAKAGTAHARNMPYADVPESEIGFADPLHGKGTLSQHFGSRPEFYGKFGLAGHEGLDWMAPEGTNIYPVAPGTITSVTKGKDYGYQVWEQLASGLGTVLYAHLKEMPALKVGQQVGMQDVIGQVGNTGNSTGPHLHFGWKPSDQSMAGAGYKGWGDPTEMFSQPVPVEGMTQLSSAAQTTAQHATTLSQAMPAGFAMLNATGVMSNSLLGNMLSILNAISVKVGTPPTVIVESGETTVQRGGNGSFGQVTSAAAGRSAGIR